MKVIHASEAGAALDSDLLNGGGTDDTAALQSVLDRAANGTPVHLVIDGPALVGGLNVYGNTTIEGINNGGLYLKDGSSRAIIRNANRSRGPISDQHITVSNCFLNGNRWNQPSAEICRPDMPAIDLMAQYPSNKEPDGTYLSGLQFLGVNHLAIENVVLWNVRAFGVLIGNANRVDIRNVTIDHGGSPDDTRYGNTDGLHFKGPLRYLTIDGAKIRVGDDGIALNADDYETDDLTIRNDFGPYVTQGSITDVLISNIHLMDISVGGIRLLSSKQRIDRVVISNVAGTVRGGYVVNIGHWMNPTSLGNFGSIQINNVNVDRSNWPAPVADEMTRVIRKISDLSPEFDKEYDGGLWPPYFSVNGHVESLIFRNVMAKVFDDHPILRIGPDAKVEMMTAELNLYDPILQAVPLKLDKGARIERLRFTVNWKGNIVDQGKNPIASLGGVIDQLQWIDTPPLFVAAERSNDHVIVVTFSQFIKAIDFSAGVTIRANGEVIGISHALRQVRADVVHYVLELPIGLVDTATWEYDAGEGNIQNWSGGQLLPVSEKAVATRQKH